MKKLNLILLLFVFVFASGCAGNRELIGRMGTSVRHDVFQEVAAGDKPVPGYADLTISASLKTHRPGAYSAADLHGSPDYRLLLNIDGQMVAVTTVPRSEQSRDCSSNDPEAGDGIRYQFSKKVRVKAGAHTIVVAIPADDIAAERKITLSDERINFLTVEPVYGPTPGKQRPGFCGTTSFKEGIRSIRVVLNGENL